jgi:hypothetical protein
MKIKIGIVLYPLVIFICLAIFTIGMIGIAIRAMASEAFLKIIEVIYD